MKDAAINTAVGLEVFCWFFIGECIGKGSLVGYQVLLLDLSIALLILPNFRKKLAYAFCPGARFLKLVRSGARK